MSRIFVVFEVNATNRFQVGPAHGYFSTFESAEAYTAETYTPEYARMMAICETTLHDKWPSTFEGHNKLTYYTQIGGKVVKTQVGLWSHDYDM